MQIYLYLIYFCKHMRFPFVLIHPSLLLLRPPPPLPPPFHSSPPPVYINFHHFNHSAWHLITLITFDLPVNYI